LKVKSVTFGADLTIKTPLFQTNLFLAFMHVKVFPEAIDLTPALVHAPPDLTAAFTGMIGRDIDRESIDKNAISLLFIYIA
jgi:hypothetical protein